MSARRTGRCPWPVSPLADAVIPGQALEPGGTASGPANPCGCRHTRQTLAPYCGNHRLRRDGTLADAAPRSARTPSTEGSCGYRHLADTTPPIPARPLRPGARPGSLRMRTSQADRTAGSREPCRIGTGVRARSQGCEKQTNRGPGTLRNWHRAWQPVAPSSPAAPPRPDCHQPGHRARQDHPGIGSVAGLSGDEWHAVGRVPDFWVPCTSLGWRARLCYNLAPATHCNRR